MTKNRIILVHFICLALISIFANPSSSDHAMVRIISQTDQLIQKRLVDLLSRNISPSKAELHIGENNFPFYSGHISKGIYTLVLEQRGKTIFKRLVVSDC